ncbi:MAG: hypothetical protein JO254_11615 [Pseudolabrys sp.]|nr:hypothetical protein [Pseudolabrys sp.]
MTQTNTPNCEQIDAFVALAREQRSAALGELLAQWALAIRHGWSWLIAAHQGLHAKHS